jgi:ArsR family transcriptional regulator
MEELRMLDNTSEQESFPYYALKFKALADAQRLQIMNHLVKQGNVCVCDLAEIVNMQQSKLSYHLKILLEANLIKVETHGKWNYYRLNENEVKHLLSEELCCLFRPAGSC